MLKPRMETQMNEGLKHENHEQNDNFNYRSEPQNRTGGFW